MHRHDDLRRARVARARAAIFALIALPAAAISCATGGTFPGDGTTSSTTASGSTSSTTASTSSTTTTSSSTAMGGSGGTGQGGSGGTGTATGGSGGTGTVSTTTTATGSGGTGGAGPMPCTMPTDCPPPPNACVQATCKFSFCDTSNVALGTVVSQEPNGDCHRETCDGMGHVVNNIFNADAPNDGKACTHDVCTGGVPLHPAKTMGTACNEGGGKLCNGSGVCVPCLADADCGAGKTCVGQQCI